MRFCLLQSSWLQVFILPLPPSTPPTIHQLPPSPIPQFPPFFLRKANGYDARLALCVKSSTLLSLKRVFLRQLLRSQEEQKRLYRRQETDGNKYNREREETPISERHKLSGSWKISRSFYFFSPVYCCRSVILSRLRRRTKTRGRCGRHGKNHK